MRTLVELWRLLTWTCRFKRHVHAWDELNMTRPTACRDCGEIKRT